MIQTSNQSKFRVTLLTVLFLFVSIVLSAQALDIRQRRVTITAEDAPITSVLTTLATLSGANIVVATDPTTRDRDTEQRTTVSLRDVPLELALDTIVRSAGLSYRLVGENLFLVGPRERIRVEVGERSFIIPLNNVNAEKVAGSFDSFGGTVSAIPGQNALMVFANPETYAEIRSRIAQMDVPQQQIEIRARLIEVSINDSKRLGIDWSRLNSLTTILAENPANADGIGLPWNYFDISGSEPHGNLHDLGRLPNAQYFQKIDGFNNVGHFSRQLTAFDITLDWLLENNAAKLLTDTRISALSGVEAEIFIGEVIPFVVMNNDREVQVERVEAGIKLPILATVNSDGLITATVSPEVSSVVDLVGGFVPRVKTRSASSTFTVPSGQKFHVGGLLSSNLITTSNKVPLLGGIPFIGRLFRHQVTYVQNTDLVIEITPRVINLAEEQYDFEVDSRLGRELIRRVSEEEREEQG